MVAPTITKTRAPDSTTNTTTVTGRRRRSRSPVAQARTESMTITAGKKRKSTASSSGATSSVYVADDMIADRGRKVKLKPKTQTRHAVENSTSVVEQQHPHRSSGKEKSRSHDSTEQLKKHTVMETGALDEKSVLLSSAAQSDNNQTSGVFEFYRVKKELELLKAVRSCFEIS